MKTLISKPDTSLIKMATIAFAHGGHDISRSNPDYMAVTREDADNYYGSWVEGFGFYGVRFPKASTREMTDAEREHYEGIQLAVGGIAD